jgi:hypothetical protein
MYVLPSQAVTVCSFSPSIYAQTENAQTENVSCQFMHKRRMFLDAFVENVTVTVIDFNNWRMQKELLHTYTSDEQ